MHVFVPANEYLKHDPEKGEPVFAGYERETAFAPRSRRDGFSEIRLNPAAANGR